MARDDNKTLSLPKMDQCEGCKNGMFEVSDIIWNTNQYFEISFTEKGYKELTDSLLVLKKG